MILVVGATGQLGGEICRKLKDKGEAVRGFVRPGARREHEIASLGVEIAHGDLKDAPSVETACRGVRSVVSTATCIMSRRRGDTFEKVDRDGLLKLIKAAKHAGVEYFQFMSVTPNFKANSSFARYKRLVERAIRESGMAWNVFLPGAFMETSFSKIAGWDLEKGKVRIVGSGTTLASFISLHDVADFSIAAVRDPSLHDRDIPLGGPEGLSVKDAIKVFEEALGKALKVSHVPIGTLKTMKILVRPFNPHLSAILGIMTGIGDDVIDMSETAKLIPGKLTSVRDYAQRVAATLR